MELTEHQIQKTYFSWLYAAEKVYKVLALAFAVPNEGKRSYKVAAMMKARGLRKGVLDVFLPFPRQGYTGLVIEFKTPYKVMSEEQEAYAKLLASEGWKVVVLWDAEAAIEITKRYLGVW